MRKIRFGVIGCGRIFEKHLNALKSCEDAVIAAVCDMSEDKAKEASSKCGGSWFVDYKEMIKNVEFDIVDICTPNDSHADIAVYAANAGKHVLTEKPMALTVDDCDRMIRACEENNVRLFVVKQNRFNLPIVRLREALEKGRFGKLFLGNVTVRWSRPQEYYDKNDWHGTKNRDGGMLFTQASHHIDMLQWMFGPVHSVKANIATLTHDIETEDNAVVVIKFKSGALGVVEATTSTFLKNLEGSVTVLGDKGSVKIGGMAMNKVDYWEFSDFQNEDDNIRTCTVNPPNVYGFGHIEVIRNVVRSLNGEKSNFEVDGFEGRKTVKLIKAAYEAAETGKEVIIYD